MSSPFKQRSSGFTLLEVLIALVVLAVALAAAVTATSRYVDNSAYLRNRSLAHWVAMNRITEAYLATEWPGVGKKRGDELMGGNEWAWSREVLATADDDVRRVEVEVRVSEDDDRPVATLVGFIGRTR